MSAPAVVKELPKCTGKCESADKYFDLSEYYARALRNALYSLSILVMEADGKVNPLALPMSREVAAAVSTFVGAYDDRS